MTLFPYTTLFRSCRGNGFDGHARAMIEQATVPQDWEAVPSEENTKIGVNPYLPAPVVENPEPELDWLYTDVEWKNYEGPTLVADHAHVCTTLIKINLFMNSNLMNEICV